MATACRFCSSPLEQVFADLGTTPLANSLLEPAQLHAMEPHYPLVARVCDRCHLVQLDTFESPEHIFSDYAYFSSYSESWLEHCRHFAEEAVRRFQLGEQSRVVEIASNDGYLLQFFKGRVGDVLGIEPARNVAQVAVEKGIPTLARFFGVELATELAVSGRGADLLIANNVLAHVPDLNDFVAGIADLLNPGGVFSVEFPHLLQLIRNVQFDTIYHEHFSYFSLLTVEKVLGAHGLNVFDVTELPTHGGSLRICAQAGDTRERTPAVTRLLDAERGAGLDQRAAYASFSEDVKRVKREVLKFMIGAREEGKSIAGYGAPAKGNTFLNYCGIGPDFIDYTVDLSPHKQGRHTPGMRIPIEAPGRIRETRPDYVLILPWNLRTEIMAQMADIRDWGGRFVTAIPGIEVC